MKVTLDRYDRVLLEHLADLEPDDKNVEGVTVLLGMRLAHKALQLEARKRGRR